MRFKILRHTSCLRADRGGGLCSGGGGLEGETITSSSLINLLELRARCRLFSDFTHVAGLA